MLQLSLLFSLLSRMNALISKCFDEVCHLDRNATFAAISYKVNKTVSMDGLRNIE